MTFDILIKDGTLIDGSGRPRFRADLGLSGGVIKAVGSPVLAGAEGRKAVSASGKFVAPGFVDITSHADTSGALFLNPGQDYLLTQGVTTILVGNCGASLAPLVSSEAAQSLRKWSWGSATNINWLSVGELVAELSRQPLGVNAATLMGHGTIRRGILKGASRPLSLEELGEFSSVISRGMTEGAFGLSAGLIYSHEAAATQEELIALGRTISHAGGILKIHLRHEGQNLIPAMNEVVQAARESHVEVIISHFKAVGRRAWPFFERALQMMERVNENGGRLHFDLSPYQRTGSFLYLLLPAWTREGGFAPMLERMRDPATRSAIAEELKRQTLHFDRYIVASADAPSANGRTIAELAGRAGQAPEETLLDLVMASRGRVTVFGRTLSFKNIVAGLTHPLGAVASDGSGVFSELGRAGKLVHPRSTGTFPHFFHKFVREGEVVSWEEGIKKVSAMPAELVGLKNRGRIAEGYAADIVIFDPDRIRERSTYQNPYVHSVGIEAVIVNGKLAVENGQLTGTAAGQVLKKS